MITSLKKKIKETKLYVLYQKMNSFILSKYPDRYLLYRYRKFYNRKLNIENPKYLSEKLQILKLYSYPNNELVVLASDKFTLHNYLTDKKMEKLIVPYLKIYERNEVVNFEELPEAFVLKKTNASGLNLIIKNKHEISSKYVNEQISRWFRTDYGLVTLEPHYSKSTDRVICEPYFSNLGNEYRFFMVGGEIGFIQVIVWDWSKNKENKHMSNNSAIEGHAKHYRLHFNEKWELIFKDEESPKKIIDKPKQWNKLVEISKFIGEDFPVVRVDFNEIQNEIKITELTFTPANGYLEILRQCPELDYELGSKLDEVGVKK